MTLQGNLYPNLPRFCFALEPLTNVVILVKQGETGYYPYNGGTVTGTKESVAELNAGLGVTLAQSSAMSMGSLFGFHAPAANPDNYDEQGNFKLDEL